MLNSSNKHKLTYRDDKIISKKTQDERINVIIECIKEIPDKFETGHAREHAYRIVYEKIIRLIDKDVMVINEPRRSPHGTIDFLLMRHGLCISNIEFKDVVVNLVNESEKDQIERYKKQAHNLMLSNYLDFVWFVDDKTTKSLSIGHIDKNKNEVVIDYSKIPELIEFFEEYLRYSVKRISTASELSEKMIHIAAGIQKSLLQQLEAGEESNTVKYIRSLLFSRGSVWYISRILFSLKKK